MKKIGWVISFLLFSALACNALAPDGTALEQALAASATPTPVILSTSGIPFITAPAPPGGAPLPTVYPLPGASEPLSPPLLASEIYLPMVQAQPGGAPPPDIVEPPSPTGLPASTTTPTHTITPVLLGRLAPRPPIPSRPRSRLPSRSTRWSSQAAERRCWRSISGRDRLSLASPTPD